MRKPLIYLFSLVIASSAIWACTEKSTVSVNADTVLSGTEPTALIIGQGNDVTLAVTSVAENRCPANAFCIWAGYVQVNFVLKQGTSTSQNFSLCLGSCNTVNIPSPGSFVLNGTTYYIELTEVLPYPGSPTDPPTPKVTVKIYTK